MNKPNLMEQVRAVARMLHLSLRTEESSIYRIKRYIRFHHRRRPSEMGADEIRAFLSHLAVAERIAAATQTVALCALLFLYRDVLRLNLPFIEGIERARRPTRLPVVFSRAEVDGLLARHMFEAGRNSTGSCRGLRRERQAAGETGIFSNSLDTPAG